MRLHISVGLFQKLLPRYAWRPSSSLGSPGPVTLMMWSRRSCAVEHQGRGTENNIEMLVPTEKDTSSCPFTAHDREAVATWEADRQCFCGSSDSGGGGKYLAWKRQCLPSQSHSALHQERRESSRQMVPPYLPNGMW